MKIFKKFVSICAVLAMVLAMTVVTGTTAFADHETYTVKINDANGSDEHSYEAYQVFTGDLANGKLSNIEWGSGVNADALQNALKGTEFEGNSASEVADKLAAKPDNVDQFAKIAAEYLTVAAGSAKEGETMQLPAGYYLIKDTSTNLTTDTVSKYMLNVVGPVTITPKSTTTESQKKVKEKNDSTGEETGWQDGADYDIGDDVPFQLTGKVASDYNQYSTYYFAFHDKQCEGLGAPENISVKVGDTTLDASDYQVVTEGLTDGCTFEIVFNDLKTVKDATIVPGTVITVEYTAALNDKAVIGAKGNPNTSHITFSNNPNDEQNGRGKTPDDTVIVFTYETIVNKVKTDQTPLEGAGFTLSKLDSKEGTYVPVKTIITGSGDNHNQFDFKGLDAGQYKLVETTVPAGYNKMQDIEFTITAKYETKSDEPKFISLMDKTKQDTINLGTQEATVNPQAGTITADVVNKSGAELPYTGGIGTRIFYTAGAILVAAGVALLIAKKRKAEEN